MNKIPSFSRAALAATLIAISACVPKVKPSAAAVTPPVPRRVLVATVDPMGAAAVDIKSGASIGMGLLFGGASGAVQVGAQTSPENRLTPKLRTELGPWDFQKDLNVMFLASTTPPPGWEWVNGAGLDPAIRTEIVDLYNSKKAVTPLTRAYAAKERIDLILIVSSEFYGVNRNAGYQVRLQGMLLEASDHRKVLWKESVESPKNEGRGEIHYDVRGPNDGTIIRNQIREQAEKASRELTARLKSYR